MKLRLLFAVVIVCALGIPGAAAPSPARAQDPVFYAKPAPTGSGTCDSWDDACDLQTALGMAILGGKIWVAEGVHYPDYLDPGLRSATFGLIAGVALYGGFAGGETLLEQRDWAENETILSGDIGTPLDPSDNAYHVVTVAITSTTATALLDGFTITGGNADLGGLAENGGGMVILGDDTVVRHVTFQDNHADYNGGGLYISGGASPTLTDVAFSENTALWGGGLYIAGLSSPTLTGATFTANKATNGGAIYNGGDLLLTDAAISDQIVYDTGGGIYNDGHVELIDVVLSNNQADDRGGGVFNALGLVGLNGVQVTFKGNSANSGGGLHNEGGQVELIASAFAGNMAATGGGLANIAGDLKLYNTAVSHSLAMAEGGGLYTGNMGHTTLHGCTVDNNDASGDGGGAYSEGWLTLLNSTVSSNNAAGYGGGIRTAGIWTGLHNVTLTANQADSNGDGTGDGGGLYFEGGTVAISSTIIAANLDSLAGEVHPDYACTFAVEWDFGVEYSLFGDGTGCLEEPIDLGPGNQAGDSDMPLDPVLLRLGDNGGETQTHALRFDSPARDGGDPTGCKDEFATVTLFDQRGTARHRDGDGDGVAECDIGAFEAGGANDSWTRAQALAAGSVPAHINEYVDMLGQSRWYKFPVQPGSLVTVELWPPATNLDIALFGDIQAVYDSLTAPAGTQDLVKLNAQFAGDAFNEDAYAPDALSPDAHSTAAYSPFAYSPFAYSPFAYSPFAYSPFAYSPFAYSPFAYSPFAYSPFAYSPFAYSPFAYSPFAYSPDPAYSGAQMQSLIAVSAFEGGASELITVNTWAHSGDYYLRVSGRNGAFDVLDPFILEVTMQTGVCEGVTPALEGERLEPVGADFETLILVDWSRFDSADPDLNELETKLGQLAAQVGGVVVNVGDDGYVQAANLQADAHPECPYAKNLAAAGIRDIVRAYRQAGHPLQYVVLVGGDEVIPFFRYPDRAMLAHESRYDPPVAGDTASFASLSLGYVLSQDAYGASLDLSLQDTTLPFPDLAVGRLVETAADIIPVLDAYLASGSLAPASALVTGYDFLADAAAAIQAELQAGLGGGVDTLISPADISPLDRDGDPPQDAAWPAEMMGDQLLGARHDLIFLAGHFNAQGALAGDYETRLWAEDLASSAVDLANAVIYSAGCHAGYNVVNEHGIPDVTIQPDWAQAFGRKGATFVGGTGYQYGDTDFIEFGERLYLEFTRQLRCGGDVAVGQALVQAKQAYLAGTAQMRGIDEKTLLQATLYGLPMLQVTGLSNSGCPGDPGSVVPLPLNGAGRNPGLTLGLLYSNDVTVASSLTQHAVTLNCYDGDDPACPTLGATYYSGSQGTVTNPAEPILPLERRNVSVDGVVLRGAGFRGGHYTDQPDVAPLTGAATTEIRAARAPFVTDVYYPIQPWSVNYYDALADPVAGITWLDVTPAQFLSSGTDDWTGTLRLFSDVTFRLFYSANTENYGGNIPALATAPSIQQVTSSVAGSTVTFQARVAGDVAAGVQEVWVTYTTCDAGGACDGEWRSLDLAQNTSTDTTLWEADLDLSAHPFAADEIRYIVQAVNGVGLAAAATNLGEYYRAGIDPAAPSASADPAAPPPEQTTLTLQSHAASGAYSTDAAFSAVLTDYDNAPLAGQTVIFSLGAQQRRATTDSAGEAQVTFALTHTPGTYNLQVQFAGTTAYKASSDQSSFEVVKQGTALSLAPDPGVAQYSDEANLVATLLDAGGKAMREKTVLFAIPTADGAHTATGITNLLSQAGPGRIPLPPGSYSVQAYFGEVVTVDGWTIDLTDANYLAAAPAAGGLIVYPEDAGVTYTGATVVGDDGVLNLSALVTQEDDGAPGDLTLAQVLYVVRDAGGAIVATAVGDVAGDGASTAQASGLEAGAYLVEVHVVGEYFSSNMGLLQLLSLYLPLEPVALGSSVSGEGAFTDPDAGDEHVAVWDWGDGQTCDTSLDADCALVEPSTLGPGTVTGQHTYAQPGVYAVTLTVRDLTGNTSALTFRYVVVYDPSAGFVTGGGWIWSPAGAYPDDAALSGKANFGFTSKYKKGASEPTGVTEFQFKAGGLNFHSDTYQWLVVAGAKAKFKGVGTINGAGNYGFLISAVDAALTPATDVDLFRIKIWDRDDGDRVVYDNQMGAAEDAEPTTQIGGGSIVVHKGKK